MGEPITSDTVTLSLVAVMALPRLIQFVEPRSELYCSRYFCCAIAVQVSVMTTPVRLMLWKTGWETTVSNALELVTEPNSLLTTTEYVAVSAADTLNRVKTRAVEPEMWALSLKLFPFIRH